MGRTMGDVEVFQPSDSNHDGPQPENGAVHGREVQPASLDPAWAWANWWEGPAHLINIPSVSLLFLFSIRFINKIQLVPETIEIPNGKAVSLFLWSILLI